MGFVKAIDELPRFVKLILCIPFLNIVWAVYRIVKGACTKNWTTMVAGIIWGTVASFFAWAVDLVCLILDKEQLFTEGAN